MISDSIPQVEGIGAILSAMALLHAEDTTAKGLHIKGTKRNEFHSTTSST